MAAKSCVRWTQEEISVLKKKYGTIKIEELHKELSSHSIQAIQKEAQRQGLKGNPALAAQQYSYDKHYFDKPTVDNCYWAGFIAADGCFGKDGLVQFSLAAKDKELLIRFKKAVNYTGPIKEYICDGRPYVKISVWAAYRWQDKLEQFWNITLRKSNTLEPPYLVCKSHIYSYIIGYFDGDGTIHKAGRKGNSIVIGFCGTHSMMEWIREQCLLLCDAIPKNKIHSNGNSEINKAVRWGGNSAKLVFTALCNHKPELTQRLKRKWVDWQEQSVTK